MESRIEFSFHEINALNKLLGRIQSESFLDANEIDFFAMSPLIKSAFEKVHKEFMTQIRHQRDLGIFKTIGQPVDLNPDNDFRLTDEHSIGDRGKRLLNLEESRKKYIQTRTKEELQRYCDQVFAPFIPTPKQRAEILEILNTIASERNK